MIRKMTSEDVARIMVLEKRSGIHPWSEADLLALCDSASKIGLVYEENNEISGYVGASWVIDECEIGNICVDPDCRRRGIARALIRRLKELLFAQGVRVVFLEVSEGNTGAVALYESEGFEMYSKRKDYYGPGDDALLYRSLAESNRLLGIASELHALASGGLTYTKDSFDKERFEQIIDLAAELVTVGADGITKEEAKDLFEKNDGYPTPKTETRAIIFNDRDEVLLVKDYDGKWTAPGGWCDRDQTVHSNVKKEAWEEAGLIVEPVRLVAVHSHKMRNNPKSFFSCLKYFVLCEVKGGSFRPNDETTESAYFPIDALPEDLNTHKVNHEQFKLCLKAHKADTWIPEFD